METTYENSGDKAEGMRLVKTYDDGNFQTGIRGTKFFAEADVLALLREAAAKTDNTVDDRLVELVGIALTNKNWADKAKVLLGF